MAWNETARKYTSKVMEFFGEIGFALCVYTITMLVILPIHDHETVAI